MITVGIDEVGRGCWAGPLVAAAVVLREPIDGLRDSKKLTRVRRAALSAEIYDKALSIGLGWVWPADIDTYGISISVKRAMEDALKSIDCPYDSVVVDGNINYLEEYPGTSALVRADDLTPAVSAASIVAKVARDKYMVTVAHSQYPDYGFDRHVGYGTALHVRMLEQHGVTEIHRRSYKPVGKLVLH